MYEDYVTFDLEMTGTKLKEDRILEIGACKVRSGEVTDTFHTMVNPGREIPEFITTLTGITQEEVQDAPGQEEAVRAFLDFAGEDVLIGHNVMYDYSFIKVVATNHDMDFHNLTLDTLKIARCLLPEEQSKKLESLSAYYNIEHHAHRGLQDALATHMVYQRLLKDFGEPEEYKDVFIPKVIEIRPKKSGPATKGQIVRLQRLAELYKEPLTVDLETLTRSEASRMADRMVAKYGIIDGVSALKRPARRRAQKEDPRKDASK